MEDRKLYHLVNGEFVHDGMPYLRTPTYEEVNTHIAILRDVGFFDDPVTAESVTFAGISNGKRNTEVQASLFDAMMAEIIGDRNAEKAKVRNRRASERKARVKNPRYVKRNGGEWRRSVHYEGEKSLHYEESLRMPESRANSKAESAERDYAVELQNRDDALAESSDYMDFAIDHGEKAERLRNRLADLEYYAMLIEELEREAEYEEFRAEDMMRIADAIMEGECY